MKKLFTHIVIIVVLTGLFACEEEYKDFKAEKYEPGIVIEGLITNNNPPYYVKVSRTVSFGDSIYNKNISTASVRLSDNAGNTELLSMQEPGVYRSDSIKGEPGNTYKLEVRIGDSVYISNCVMPPAIIVDSLITVFHENNGINKKGYYVKFFGKKPQTDSINYYKCQIWQNSRLITNRSYSIVFNDMHTSSTQVGEFTETFSLHDTVEIEFMSVTKEIYKYFVDINMVISDDAFVFDYQRNPSSNITNGAFGYFQASAIKKMKVIIQ